MGSWRTPEARHLVLPLTSCPCSLLQDSQVLIELHKSGFARPGDVEFEDFSQPMNRVPSDSSLGTPSDGRPELRGPGRSRAKRWPFGKKNKVGAGALGKGSVSGDRGAPTESAPAAGTLSPGQEFASWLLAQAGGKGGGWVIGLGVPQG